MKRRDAFQLLLAFLLSVLYLHREGLSRAKPLILEPSLLFGSVFRQAQKGVQGVSPGRASTASKPVGLFVPARLCRAIARSAMHKPTRSVGSEMGVPRLARNCIVSTNTTIRGSQKGTPSGEERFRGGHQAPGSTGPTVPRRAYRQPRRLRASLKPKPPAVAPPPPPQQPPAVPPES